MENKTLLENDDQFVVSYELLYILQWLLIYEQEAFTKLIHKSFIQGSQATSNDTNVYEKGEESEYLQHSVVDFFSFLEKEVENISDAEAMKHILQRNLLKTLDHIDPKIFDPAIIKESMLTAAEKVHPERNHHAKDIFLKQLLKNWHPKKGPNKKHTLN